MRRSRRPCPWCPLLLFVIASPLAAQDGVQKNRLWPEDLILDAEKLHELRKEVCARSGKRSSEETKTLEMDIREKSTFPPQGFPDPENPGKGGFLPYVLSVRGEQFIPSALSKVVESCGAAARSFSDNPGCASDWDTYFFDMAMPFAIPLALGGLFVVMHSICCFVACCRCCRRQMCCRERQAPKHASFTKKVLMMVTWVPIGIAIFLSGLSVHYNNFDLHQMLNWHLCTVLQLADEAIGGSDDLLFLGTEHAHTNLKGIAKSLDIDGSTMYTIRKVIDQTEDFATKQEQLERRVEHFTAVLQMSGPTVRSFEHRCVFCSVAVGDKDNLFAGFPEEGLLPAMSASITESSSQAMDGIRKYTSTRLTGTNLTSMASKVKRAMGAFEILDSALRQSFVDIWAVRVPTLDTAESIRIFVFIIVGMSAMSSVPLGWLGFVITRLRLRRRPDVVPSGKPHCCSWCCGFCYVSACFLIGGALVMAALFAGEGCVLTRLELLEHSGLERYASALGLAPRESLMSSGYYDGATWQTSSQVAVGLAQSCFTVNGTGDMLVQMELDDKFDFQPELSAAFWRLEDLTADPPTGYKTADYLSILQATASEFGGLFVLDPMPLKAGKNGSLGILSLNPNVRDLLLGSSIVAEDTRSPDGRMEIGGLNSYAALIAGPGKYTFAHGTAGGGFVITSVRPDEQEITSLPPNVRNALLYGRAKERLLVSTDSLRCDELDVASGAVTKKLCSVKEFHAFVVAEVARLAQALEASATAAMKVQHLFLNELRQEVAPTLRLVRDLRMMTGCRFLWRRMEAFDDATCEYLASTTARVGCMNLALAVVGMIGTLLHYKVWRHLKDNKVVGLEMLRFERTYKGFQHKMAAIESDRHSKHAAKHAYQQAIDDMQANALHHHEVKDFAGEKGGDLRHTKMDEI